MKNNYIYDVLFICKKRMDSAGMPYAGGFSSGLLNSAKFVSDMLDYKLGLASRVVQVVDGNDIDRELTKYKPQLCIIEANWVTPDKFKELMKLHPKVRFMVRIHSEIPFLSLEGIAFEWISQYLEMGLAVSFNSERTANDMKSLYTHYKSQISHTPNYYPIPRCKKSNIPTKGMLFIGCFGAIRPFKNQLIQAIAAIKFANKTGKILNFYVNSERVEGGGNPVLKNLRALFNKNDSIHSLIELPWLKHEDFITYVRAMDIGMQVSYNETFNIVSADFVSRNVPIVTSDEVEFVHPIFYADPNSVNSIVKALEIASKGDRINAQYLNKRRLKASNDESVKVWKKLLIKGK
jgi:hypothetical protein